MQHVIHRRAEKTAAIQSYRDLTKQQPFNLTKHIHVEIGSSMPVETTAWHQDMEDRAAKLINRSTQQQLIELANEM